MPELKSTHLLAGVRRGATFAGRGALWVAGVAVDAVRRRARGSGDPLDETAAKVSPTGPPSSRPEGTPPEPEQSAGPERAPAGIPATGFPEPPGKDPGDISGHSEPHHALNNPVVDDPDPTEWPDPYERRADPRDPDDPDGEPFGAEPHPPSGSISTSEPHPSQDPEAGDRWEGPKRDKLDD